ncbi:MAG: hypothetical protein JOZ78_16480 [Chroococcidiopsidaceae cyanobacterium CP_BM_ER_R8_30]|nr:hypothetical protein [Chroococcidiopsidaceae cyanobacterium CP_BM_ER_R8_30]
MLQHQVVFLSLVAAATAAFGTTFSLTSAPALADSFDFAYSGPGITASGVLTTESLGSSIIASNTEQQTEGYLITGITGFRNGTSIDMLLPTNSVGGNDNLLIAAPPYLDQFGFAYEAGGITYYNAFNITPGGYFELSAQTSSATPLTSFSVTSVSATPVPEPSEEMAVVGIGVWISSVWGQREKKVGTRRNFADLFLSDGITEN